MWSFVFWLLNFDKIRKRRKEKAAHFSLWVLAYSQKCEGCLDVFTSYRVYKPNLAKFFSGRSPLQLHNKNDKKRHRPQDDKMGGIIKGMFLGKWQNKIQAFIGWIAQSEIHVN